MLEKSVGRRQALVALPRIGSALGFLPVIAGNSGQAAAFAEGDAKKTALLPLGIVHYWACALVGFGWSGYQYVMGLNQAAAPWAGAC